MPQPRIRSLPFATKGFLLFGLVLVLSIVGNGMMSLTVMFQDPVAADYPLVVDLVVSNTTNDKIEFENNRTLSELPLVVHHLDSNTTKDATTFKDPAKLDLPFRDLVSDTTKDLAVVHVILNTTTRDPFCDGIPSSVWRNSPRLPNLRITEDVAGLLMDPNHLKHLDFLTGQTMCLRDSPFRRQQKTSQEGKLENNSYSEIDPTLLEAWEYKLTYLAIHALFHEPAQEEYKARKQCINQGGEKHKKTSSSFVPYEYECPNAKYLITRFSGLGFGASVRAGVMYVLVASLITNRIPVFMGNKIPRLAAERWRPPNDQFSCPDRKDYQCIFLPLSPCTPTFAELANATRLTEDLRRFLLESSKTSNMTQAKVLQITTPNAPYRFTLFPKIMRQVRERIHDKVVELISTWANSTSMDTDDDKRNHLKLLNLAADQILSTSGNDSRIFRPFLLYMLRPNSITKEKIDKKIREIMPSEQSMDPKLTLGMPIRGSDKCMDEATCLPFANYMELANETGINGFHLRPLKRKGHLILTTEDRTLFDQRHNYSSAKEFPFDFVVNEEDTFQGTGRAKLFTKIADEVILGSMITMQMQMHAGYVIGNCCSNFHNLLFSMLKAGCGHTQKLLCMQDITNPRYRICCRSDKSEECKTIRKRFSEEKKSLVGLLKPYQKQTKRRRGKKKDSKKNVSKK